MRLFSVLFLYLFVNCDSFKILAIFPYNGRSHHIFYSSLVEELARREHDVTVINYHSVKELPKLHQIFLQDNENTSDHVNIEEHLKLVSSDILMAYDTAQAFKYIANVNCKKLMTNPRVQEMIHSREPYDVVIVEQFVTDCGLAVAYKLNAPTVGMTAHILMPWTYSRLGAPSNTAFVPNHFFATGSKPTLLNRIKSAIINFGMNMYFKHMIQKSDQEIVNVIYPDIPALEDLGRSMSLIMLNQYFPLTGPRLYGPNVVEIGGMHINKHQPAADKPLHKFLETSGTSVVYISFGTVASNFPRKITDEIIKLIESSNLKFVWKTDLTNWTPPSNVFVGKWIPQQAVLCHPNVVAFVSHSGMLSTSEAMHCGVPIVGVPLFGDQFANGASAVENGLGVTVNIAQLNYKMLDEALRTVLQAKYQKRAKVLSKIWKDRPLSPMDTAIYWIEYVARNKGDVNLKPPTVDLPLYKYYMLDLLLVFGLVIFIISYCTVKVLILLRDLFQSKKSVKKEKRKKKE